MIKIKFKKYQYPNFTVFVLFILFTLPLFSQEQNLKKEINIPFPENITIEESISIEKKNAKTISQPAKEPVKKYLSIPFPNDPEGKNSPGIELKKVEITNPEENRKVPAANIELPLEKIIVFPKIDIPNTLPPTNESKKAGEANPTIVKEKIIPAAKEVKPPTPISNEEVKSVKVVEEKKVEAKTPLEPTNDKGKALIDKKNPEVISSKSIKTPDSKLDLGGEYGLVEATKKPPIAKEASSAKKATPKKAAEVTLVTPQPVTNLPNIEKPGTKKGKGKKDADESMAPYERSKYYLNRDDKPSAISELNAASSGDGENSNLARMDQIRLLAHDRKKNEAKNIIDGISDLEFRYKGLYELAVGLENSAKSDKKLKEESIPYHLAIITEAPKTNPIVPKSLWALSHLLFTIGDHTPALDHLSNIIKNHGSSEYADDAIYLSGRIYEESTSIRNLNRAKKYYELFLKNTDKPLFKESIYFPFVKKRLELLEN